MEPLHIIGGGMAGSEAAWQAAEMGVKVVLHEMRPQVKTFAHRTGDFALNDGRLNTDSLANNMNRISEFSLNDGRRNTDFIAQDVNRTSDFGLNDGRRNADSIGREINRTSDFSINDGRRNADGKTLCRAAGGTSDRQRGAVDGGESQVRRGRRAGYAGLYRYASARSTSPG